MNAVVLLRAVRDPSSFSVNRRAQKVFINSQRFILNPADRNALEAALTLRDAGWVVTAIACGGLEAEDVLRQALAAGADRAILADDEALQTADAGPVTAVVRQLLPLVEAPALLLLGASVLDADLAQVGPRLAAALDWPFAGGVLALEAPAGGNVVRVVVREGERLCCKEASLPAVAAIVPDSNKPRYAPAASVINAFKDDDRVERLSLAALGLSASDLAHQVVVRGQAFPPERELGRRFEGTPDELAALVRRMAAA